MNENENTYRYGAGSAQEKNLDIQREHERQARQREADAQRAHDQQIRDIEKRQSSSNRRKIESRGQRNKTAPTNTTKKSTPASNSEVMICIIVLAGLVAGFYLTSVYINPSDAWMIWVGTGLGGTLAYWQRKLIIGLLKIGIVVGGIYVVFTHILPALSS